MVSRGQIERGFDSVSRGHDFALIQQWNSRNQGHDRLAIGPRLLGDRATIA